VIYNVGLIAFVSCFCIGTSLTVTLLWIPRIFTFPSESKFSLTSSRQSFVCLALEARMKWLTALLVQHYESFHPDLVALNRQPIGNQRVKHWVQLKSPSGRSLASLRGGILTENLPKLGKSDPYAPRHSPIYERGEKWEFGRETDNERRAERMIKREKERNERMSERREGADDEF